MIGLKVYSVLSVMLLCVPAFSGENKTISPVQKREVQNLRAFTKLYGYVRYFHPSDEASSIDWDAFVVYGVGQVKEAKNNIELKRALKSLFLPIAPTIQIYDVNQNPRDHPESLPKDTAGLKVVAWQHLGLASHPEEETYANIRLNRDTRLPEDFGVHVGHKINPEDVVQYRGRDIKVRAAIKASFDSPGSWGRLRFKGGIVSSERVTVMEGPGVTEWTVCELSGKIADDAEQLKIMIVFGGKGQDQMWADDVEVSVADKNGQWKPIKLENPGFEQTENFSSSGWSRWGGWYKCSIDKTRPYEGRQCLLLEYDGSKLFDGHPKVGETVTKPLDSDLFCRVPLALYSNEKGTLGRNDAYPFSRLSEQLKGIDPDTFTADDKNVRIADVIVAWNVFQHFYPYFDVVDVDWDSELTYALQRTIADRNKEDFWYTFNRLLATVKDGHIALFMGTPPSAKANLPLLFDWIEDHVVVTRSAESSEVKRGDIILSIDGVNAEDILSHHMQFISGSPQFKKCIVFKWYKRLFGSGEPGTKATLVVKRMDRIFKVELERITPGTEPWLLRPKTRTSAPAIKEIQDGVYYVDLLKVKPKELEESIDVLAKARGVVFDYRGRPFQIDPEIVIRHLLQSEDTSDAWFMTPMITYPDFTNVTYKKKGWGLIPSEPHIRGKVVFLTNAAARCASECFLSFVEHYNLGEIVGQATAGYIGTMNTVKLPSGFKLIWTGQKVVKHDGSQHHLIGITPTVPVKRTIQGLIEGRDEYLEKALEIINE